MEYLLKRLQRRCRERMGFLASHLFGFTIALVKVDEGIDMPWRAPRTAFASRVAVCEHFPPPLFMNPVRCAEYCINPLFECTAVAGSMLRSEETLHEAAS